MIRQGDGNYAGEKTRFIRKKSAAVDRFFYDIDSDRGIPAVFSAFPG